MNAKFMKNNGLTRIYEFDILRIIAAISIILTHLWYFFPVGSDIQPIFLFFGECGLVIFFFLSGFFISRKPLNDRYQVIEFFTGRLKRLFPAMYIAIILYIIIELLGLGSPGWDIPINAWSVLSNLFGLQIYFYPLRFFALWYVSAIITYYLIHIFIKKASAKSFKKYILISLMVFPLIGLLIQINLPIYGFNIDRRIFDYYYVFFLGAISFDVFESKERWTTVYPIVLSIGLLIFKILLKSLGYGSLLYFSLPAAFVLFGVILFMITIKCGLYDPIEKIPRIIKKCSYSTYSVYLLHYPLLGLIATLRIQNLFVFIFISIVVIFLCGFILQTGVDTILYRTRSSYPIQ